jgi:hypothetical protein
VRDERPDLLGMPGDQNECVTRAAAAGEDVNRSRIEHRDDPMQIVGMLVGRGLRRTVGPHTRLGSAGIVDHDRSVGEVLRERVEAGRAHRGRDLQQNRLARRVVSPNVIGQRGPGHV